MIQPNKIPSSPNLEFLIYCLDSIQLLIVNLLGLSLVFLALPLALIFHLLPSSFSYFPSLCTQGWWDLCDILEEEYEPGVHSIARHYLNVEEKVRIIRNPKPKLEHNDSGIDLFELGKAT